MVNNQLSIDGYHVRKKLVDNAVIGTLLFVFTEVMFFFGLISAFLVIRSRESWQTPELTILPSYTPIITTIVLLLSQFFLLRSLNLIKHGVEDKARNFLQFSALFGFLFFILQGIDWYNLIYLDVSIFSGIFWACFFFIVGAHSLHVLSGAIVLEYFALRKKSLTIENNVALLVYWSFIVFIWPVLYYLIYLSN